MAQKRKNAENSAITETGLEGLKSTPPQGAPKRPRKSRSSASKPGSVKSSAAKPDIPSAATLPGKIDIPVPPAEAAAGAVSGEVPASKDVKLQEPRLAVPEPAAAVRKTAEAALEKNALVEKTHGESPAPSRHAVSAQPDLSSAVSRQEQIALLAYSYWEARGRQGGSAEDDWYRAEQEISRRLLSLPK